MKKLLAAVSVLAGSADFRTGREARGELGEKFAPEKADGDTLGASLM